MGEVKTEPIESRLVDSLFGGSAPAGAIKFYSSPLYQPAGFHFACPCGCGAIGAVKVAGDNAWGWNGDRDKPTVRPSIAMETKDGPHWHGWLTDGMWKSC